MGIRADITPQVSRIDAHCLDRKGPVRLCYSDNVLHTKPRGIMTSRVPIKLVRSYMVIVAPTVTLK